MRLTCPRAPANYFNLAYLTMRHLYLRCAFSECSKINVQRTVSVELAQCANAIPYAGGKHLKIGLRHAFSLPLQFGWSNESQGYFPRQAATGARINLYNFARSNCPKFGFGPSCPKAFLRQLRESRTELSHNFGVALKQMQIESESSPCVERTSIQMTGSKDKRPG